MAEFKDGGMWLRLTFLMAMLGFTCDLFSFGIGNAASGGSEGGLITGFLFYLVAAVLIICIVFMDEVHCNFIALIVFVVCAIIAALATIIGYGLWGRGSIGTFSTTVGILGALLAILAAIFAILQLVGLKPKVEQSAK